MGSPDSLGRLGARLGELIRVTGLSQVEFANRLGASPTFISDLVREQKRPGAEFLLRIRQSFGVSIDWLLDGSGGMFGERPLLIDAFKLIAAEVSLARAAKVEGKPEAEHLLADLMDTTLAISADDLSIALQPYLAVSDEIVLASILYNAHLGTRDLGTKVRGALGSAAAYFESRRPLDLTRVSVGKPAPAQPSSVADGPAKILIQNVSGRNARNAGRDFISTVSKSPKKK